MSHIPKLCIFDMDGVVYRLNDPIRSAITTIQWLQDQDTEVVFFTNNSSKTPEKFQKKLRTMGIPTEISHIFTSATIAATHLQKMHPNGSLYIIGEQGMRTICETQGFEISNVIDPTLENREFLRPEDSVDAVLVGWDTQVTYGKLRTAMMQINAGAKFYATNDDASYPVPGTIWPGAGANVAFLATALARKPEIIFGKPYPFGFQAILDQFAVSPDDALMVGDRLSTDILGGNLAKIPTVCVETGVHHQMDLSHFPPTHAPTYFYQDLSEWRKKMENTS